MSFIAKNPLTIPEVDTSPSVPKSGTRGFFAGQDGWYDVDSDGKTRKIVTDERIGNTSTLINETTKKIKGGTYEFAPSDNERTISQIVLKDETSGFGQVFVYVNYSDGTQDEFYGWDESGVVTFCPNINKLVVGINVQNGNCEYKLVEYTFGTLKSVSVSEYVKFEAGKILSEAKAHADERAFAAVENAKSYTNKMIGDITALIHRDVFEDCDGLTLPENCVRVKKISFTCVSAGTVWQKIHMGTGIELVLPEEIKAGASVVLDAENNIATHDGTPFSAEPILSALKDGTVTNFSYFNENSKGIENLCIEYYVSAKTYTDEKSNAVEKNAKAYAEEIANAAEENAKGYADELANSAKIYTDETVATEMRKGVLFKKEVLKEASYYFPKNNGIERIKVTLAETPIYDTENYVSEGIVILNFDDKEFVYWQDVYNAGESFVIDSTIKEEQPALWELMQSGELSHLHFHDSMQINWFDCNVEFEYYTDTQEAFGDVKNYADEKFEKAFIPKECDANDCSAFVFVPCKRPQPTELIFSNYERKSDTKFVLTSADFGGNYIIDETYCFYGGTAKGIKCRLAFVDNDKYTFELIGSEFIGESSLDHFLISYEYFGKYDGEYKWAKSIDTENIATVRGLSNVFDELLSYTDNAIQQAILDSWEVSV